MALGGGKSSRLSEAVSSSKQAQQDIVSLRKQVEHLRVVVQALWELAKPVLNADDEKLDALVRDLSESQAGPKVAEKCAKCSRSLQDNSKFCIYCGAEVERRKVF